MPHRPTICLTLLSLLSACGAGEPGNTTRDTADSTTGEQTQPEPCTSDLATVEGSVTSGMEWYRYGEAMAFASVTATPVDDADGKISIMANEEGIFTAQLPADQYKFLGWAETCVSEPDIRTLEPCHTETVNLELVDCTLGG